MFVFLSFLRMHIQANSINWENHNCYVNYPRWEVLNKTVYIMIPCNCIEKIVLEYLAGHFAFHNQQLLLFPNALFHKIYFQICTT